MKSDIIMIDNQGKGFGSAVNETRKTAEFGGLDHEASLHLELMTEEMLSMLRCVTGQTTASFWLENEGRKYKLMLSTKAVLDAEKRSELIASTTSRKNAAATGFLGMLRDRFEQAMASDMDQDVFELNKEAMDDLVGRDFGIPDWDGYERSVLLNLADEVQIGIRGQTVNMTVIKTFAN